MIFGVGFSLLHCSSGQRFICHAVIPLNINAGVVGKTLILFIL
jgi:hypothetical protein